MALLDDRARLSPQAEAEDWLAAFETALHAGDVDGVAGLFLADGLWRDLLAFAWTIQTIAGRRRSTLCCARGSRAPSR